MDMNMNIATNVFSENSHQASSPITPEKQILYPKKNSIAKYRKQLLPPFHDRETQKQCAE